MAQRREHCRTCGAHESDCGALSRRGYCQACGEAAAVEAAAQMAARSGPAFERWRAHPLSTGPKDERGRWLPRQARG